MSKETKLSDKLGFMEKKNEEDPHNILSLAGIADAARKNICYQSLLSKLKLENLSLSDLNMTAERLVYNQYNQNVVKEQSEDSLITHNQDIKNAFADFSGVNWKTILLWKQNKYSIKSIAAITCTRKMQVNKSIAKYKRGIKKMWKMRHHINSNKRRRASHDYIEMIKEFWSLPKNQPITIKKIKRYTNSSRKDLEHPSNTTIRSILREELKMNYKILHKCHRKVMTGEHTRLYAESLSLQLTLNLIHYEVIYLDEFSFSSRK